MDAEPNAPSLRRTAGRQLRSLRIAAGWTRAALGAALGFGAKRASAYVGELEAGIRGPDAAQRDVLRALFGAVPDGWERAEQLEASARDAALHVEERERALVVALLLGLRDHVDEVLADSDACGVLLPRPFGFFHPGSLGALLIGITGPLRLPGREDAWMVGGVGSPFSGRGSVTVLDASAVSVVSPRGWTLSRIENRPDLQHGMVWAAGAACTARLPPHPRSRWSVQDAVEQLLGLGAVNRVLGDPD
jgi:transcriptional regulator with XRE-family HTH domain